MATRSNTDPIRPEGGGLRERKKRQTRQALGLVAIRLAIERGLGNVRVDDIAAEVGVSTRTFNNYFTSKQEAICALALDRNRSIAEQLRARPAGEALWDAVTAAVLTQYEVNEASSPEWTAGVRLVTSEPTLIGEYLKAQAQLRHELALAITQRVPAGTDDLVGGIIAGAVTAMIEFCVDRWLSADPPVPLGPLIHHGLDVLAGQLAGPAGPPTLEK